MHNQTRSATLNLGKGVANPFENLIKATKPAPPKKRIAPKHRILFLIPGGSGTRSSWAPDKTPVLDTIPIFHDSLTFINSAAQTA